MYNSILNPISGIITSYPDELAFCIEGSDYSFRQFGERISSIRHYIKEIKSSGKIWGLYYHNDLETYASIFALWMEGKAYVPLNPAQPEERNNNIIRQVGISDFLDSEKYDYPSSAVPLLNCFVPCDNCEIAYVLFTSGSTGVPKGVPISRGNLSSFVSAFWGQGYEISHEDKALQCFDLTFDLSIMSYLLPLLRGASVHTTDSAIPKYVSICELLIDHGITFALMTPSTLNYMKPFFSELSLPSLRYSLFCGEALTRDMAELWSACIPNAEIHNVYGPTENTIYCTTYQYLKGVSEKAHNGVLSIGKAIEHTEAIIVDDDNNPLPCGEIGELCLAGEQLTEGYWNNPEKDKEAFWVGTNGIRYYRTGDLCFEDSEHDILFVGRKDAQVKIQGFRVEIGEIEYHCNDFYKNRYKSVGSAFVNQDGITEIAVFIEGGDNSDDQPLITFLKSRLPSYMIPARILHIPRFPLNSSEKTDKKQLISML